MRIGRARLRLGCARRVQRDADLLLVLPAGAPYANEIHGRGRDRPPALLQPFDMKVVVVDDAALVADERDQRRRRARLDGRRDLAPGRAVVLGPAKGDDDRVRFGRLRRLGMLTRGGSRLVRASVGRGRRSDLRQGRGRGLYRRRRPGVCGRRGLRRRRRRDGCGLRRRLCRRAGRGGRHGRRRWHRLSDARELPTDVLAALLAEVDVVRVLAALQAGACHLGPTSAPRGLHSQQYVTLTGLTCSIKRDTAPSSCSSSGASQ